MTDPSDPKDELPKEETPKEPASQEPYDLAVKSCCSHPFQSAVFLLILMLIIGLSAAIGIKLATPRLEGGILGSIRSPVVDGTLAPRVQTLEEQIRTTNERIDRLTEQLNKMEPTGVALVESSGTPSNDAVAALKNDIASLTASVTSARQATQAQVASLITFTQLRIASQGNAPFSQEWQAMVKASNGDLPLNEALRQLEPLAAKGAPTALELADELDMLTLETESALQRAGAKNWWERIVAELKSLISVRSTSSTAMDDDPVAALRRDVISGKMDTAIEKLNAMPPEAREVLKDWRAKAETRRDVNAALDRIAGRLASPNS